MIRRRKLKRHTFESVWATMDRNEKAKKKADAELNKQIKEMSENILGIGYSNGLFSEAYFYSALENSMSFGGVEFDDIVKGSKQVRKQPDGSKLQAQFDIVLRNGEIIALIEVKYRVRKEDVLKLIDKQLNSYKILHPYYANHSYLLGIAGLAFEEEVEQEAINRGIGILKPKCSSKNEKESHKENTTPVVISRN